MGDLTVVVKLGLSIRKMNSLASKNGFLNSIAGPLALPILNGPLGYGATPIPSRIQLYSPPS